MAALTTSRKSQLAIKYAHQMRQQDPKSWVLWIHASNATRFEESLRDVADLIKLKGRSDPKAKILLLFKNWLRDNREEKWLVILDNADDADFLVAIPTDTDEDHSTQRPIDYFPSSDHGSLLITSRNKQEALKLVQRNELIQVKAMSETEAEELLDKKLGLSGSDNRRLAVALECIPLAISQAVAYIGEVGSLCSAGEYCEKIRKVACPD